MQQLLAFFKLIRIQNLLLIALCQYLFQYFILRPMFYAYYIPVTMNHLSFFILVLTTLLIAAGGNIINDIFDEELDTFNKPDKVVINKLIDEGTAQNFYYAFNFVALMMAIYLCKMIGNMQLLTYFIFCFVILWLYSAEWKKKTVLGNVLISLLAAMSIVLVWLFERNLFDEKYLKLNDVKIVSIKIFYYVMAYAAFAFLTNFIREIVKDIQDKEGDEKFGKESLPVRIGVQNTKMVLVVFYGILVAMMGYVLYYFFVNQWMEKYLYGIFLILLPLLYSAFALYFQNDAAKAKWLIKVAILTGICSMYFY